MTSKVLTELLPLSEPDGAAASVSFEAIYQEHFSFVWRSIRAFGVPAGSVDDVAQECFIIAHRKIADCYGPGSARAWLYGIARRLARDYRRSSQRRGEQHSLEIAETLRGQDDTEGQASNREALRKVQAYAKGLNEKDLDLFVLAVIHQLPMREVGEIISVNMNTAYSRLKSIRQGMLEFLTEGNGGTGHE